MLLWPSVAAAVSQSCAKPNQFIDALRHCHSSSLRCRFYAVAKCGVLFSDNEKQYEKYVCQPNTKSIPASKQHAVVS